MESAEDKNYKMSESAERLIGLKISLSVLCDKEIGLHKIIM